MLSIVVDEQVYGGLLDRVKNDNMRDWRHVGRPLWLIQEPWRSQPMDVARCPFPVSVSVALPRNLVGAINAGTLYLFIWKNKEYFVHLSLLCCWFNGQVLFFATDLAYVAPLFPEIILRADVTWNIPCCDSLDLVSNRRNIIPLLRLGSFDGIPNSGSKSQMLLRALFSSSGLGVR